MWKSKATLSLPNMKQRSKDGAFTLLSHINIFHRGLLKDIVGKQGMFII